MCVDFAKEGGYTVQRVSDKYIYLGCLSHRIIDNFQRCGTDSKPTFSELLQFLLWLKLSKQVFYF